METKIEEYRRRWKFARNDWERKGIELEVRVWKRRMEKNKRPEKEDTVKIAKEIFR